MLLEPVSSIIQKTENGYREYDFTDLGGNQRTLASLTTILSRTKPERDKEGIKRWRAKVGDEEADRIMRTSIQNGNVMHQHIEKFLMEKAGVPPIVPEDPENDHYVQYKENFLDKHDLVPRVIEGALFWYDDKEGLGFAGTVDCVAEVDGTLCLIDHKSSLNPKREDWILDYKLQVAAYAAAVEFNHGLKIEKGLINVATAKGFQQFEMDRTSLDNHFERVKDRMREFYLEPPKEKPLVGTGPGAMRIAPLGGTASGGRKEACRVDIPVLAEQMKRVEFFDGSVEFMNIKSVEYYI